MAMLNNQRVYIYIYISWYNQYVQRNLPLLAGFFSQLCTEIVPLSHYPLRELEENQRNCMDLHDGVFRTWFSPYVPHVSCLLLEKSRLEMCNLPAADHLHVGRSNEVFAPCPDPWELESWSHIPWWEVGNNMRICLVFLGSEIL